MAPSACHYALVADQEDEREVLTSLPRSRPTRRSSKRGERPDPQQATEPSSTPEPAEPPEPSEPPKPARPKPAHPKPAASTAKAKPAASAEPAKPAPPKAVRPKPARPKPARPKPPPPKPPAASERPPPKKPSPEKTTERPRIQPERKVPPAGYAAPTSGDHEGPAGATEILTTTFQAATELVQIGFSVGRQALRAALDRLPRP